MGLEGKCVIVTGSGSGIGAASAILLAEAGCAVVVADYNEAGAQETADTIKQAGGQARAIGVDVRDEEAVIRMVDLAVNTFGSLYGGVNAAAVPPHAKLLHELELSELEATFAVNMRGVFLCTKYQIRAMLRSGGGSIVNIGSTASLVGLPRSSDYCGSKAAVLGLTRAAASDYSTQGIRVNAVLPGGTLTPMMKQAMANDPTVKDLVRAIIPMDRLADPREIATSVRWLISGESSFVTGTTIEVDGGQGGIQMAPKR